MRIVSIAAGIACAILFIVAGLELELQQYGDGSIFSYAVAAQDAWAFHFHNISGRVFVYLYSLLPAETYVALTKDARGGIVLYGFLFFAAQLFGLAATYAADRSKGRIIFSFACASTALLCPLVFGAPSEMLVAHALFWPALAVSHYARKGAGGATLIFALLLALMLCHEGALVLALAIAASLSLRGLRDALYRRGVSAFAIALAAWAAVKMAFPPGDYFADVLTRAGFHFFDPAIVLSAFLLLLLGALAAYGILYAVLLRLTPKRAHIYAAGAAALGLALYWLRFDHSLHAEDRYFLRAIILLATPALGLLAAGYALRSANKLKLQVPLLPRAMTLLAGSTAVRAATGAFVLAMLIHAVETAKFAAAWTDYKAAVRTLAAGMASDPGLGDPRFVSAARIDAKLNRLSWNSTTLYLSVLLAPNLTPARLVIDPAGNYFWLTCRSASLSLAADRVIPAETRALLRTFACLHRQ